MEFTNKTEEATIKTFIDHVVKCGKFEAINVRYERYENELVFYQLNAFPISEDLTVILPSSFHHDGYDKSSYSLSIESHSKFDIENIKTDFDSMYSDFPYIFRFDLVDKDNAISNIQCCIKNENSNSESEYSIKKVDDRKYHVEMKGSPFIFIPFLPQGQLVSILMTIVYQVLTAYKENPLTNAYYKSFMEKAFKLYQLKRLVLFKIKKQNKYSLIGQLHSPEISDILESDSMKIVNRLGDDFQGYTIISENNIIPDINKILVTCINCHSRVYAFLSIDYNMSTTLYDASSLPTVSLILIQMYQLSNANRRVTRDNRILSIFRSSNCFELIEIDDINSIYHRNNMDGISPSRSQVIGGTERLVPESDKLLFVSQINDLLGKGIPILQREISYTDEKTNSIKYGQIYAVKRTSKQTGKAIYSFFFEDTTEIKKKQQNLIDAHHNFQAAMRALGLHKFNIEKGVFILSDDSLFEEIGVNPPLNRELINVIAPDDKQKVEKKVGISFMNLSSRKQALARQSTLTVRKNFLRGLSKREQEPHESPVNYTKQDSTTVRLVDGSGSYVWYTCISHNNTGFIFSVDNTVKMRRQLQTTDRGLKIASASTLLFTFWGVDVNTDTVQQLLKYDTIWDILGVDQYTPFSKITDFALDEKKGVAKMIQQIRNGSLLSWNGDVLFDSPRGKKWFRIAVSTANDGNLNCFMIDITEQKSMETLLLQSNNLRDLILSSAKIMLWTFSEGEIQNTSSSHTVNMNWEFIANEVGESSREELTNAIKTAISTDGNVDCIILMGEKWYSVRGGVTNDDKKQLVGVLFDITELNQALIDLSIEQSRATSANKMKTLFLANMSHEIRTPMNGIIGMLDILAMHELTVEQRLLTDAIRSSSFDLMKHLSNTLNVSNIEQGNIELNFCIFDISQVLQPVAVAAASRALLAKITLNFEIEPKFPVLLYGEPQLFLQIVNNLLSNALKFTKEGSVSVYFTWEKSEALLLEVSDTGIGMSEEQRNVIFRRFSQADPSVARHYGGTGLGLALVQDLIRLLNGSITFESELGKGTKFKVRLPFESNAFPYPLHFNKKKTPTLVIVTTKTAINGFLHKFVEFYQFKIEYVETLNELKALLEKNHEILGIMVDIENSGSNAHKVKQFIQKEKPDIRLCSFSTPGNSGDFPRTLTKPLLPKPLRLFLDDLRFSRKEILDLTEKAPPLAVENKTKSPSKILIVEDNKVNQFVMSKMLTKLNYVFKIAENGQIALETLDKEEFNLVFMDCQMPVMDGLEATRRIRASNKDYQNVPIVALTASAIEGDEDTCKAAGMDGYLAKPVRIQQITDAIKKFATLQ